MTDAPPDATTRVVLKLAEREWSGWTELEITRSIERVAGAFVLGVTERWVGQSERLPLRPGASCTLSVDGEVLITGWVDDVETNYDDATHQIVVKGRDRTADLFDCAAVLRPFEMGGLKLDGIARRLCQPFNIPVTAQVDVGRPFPRFAIQPGEKAWEALERACRQRAILPMADGKGGLLLTRAGMGGEAAGLLKLGGDDGNIKAGSTTLSAMELFSDYIVMGQQAPASAAIQAFGPSPDGPERQMYAPSAIVRDASVTRYRPTIILAEMQGSSVTFRQRAEWQRAVAVGKSVRGSRTVQDWRTPARLWHPNTLTRVTDSIAGLDNAEMLIVATAMRLSIDGGTTTELTLALPDAYKLIPEGDLSGSASAHDAWGAFVRPGQS